MVDGRQAKGSRKVSIEAKRFDIQVEQSGDHFKLSIVESSRRCTFSICLGRQATRWLSFVIKEIVVGRWRNLQERRYRAKDIFFIVEIRENYRGQFIIISIFSGREV